MSGTFRDLHHTRNAMSRSISLLLQSRVTAGPDRTIEWRGTRYAEVEPLVFTSLDGRNTIMFRHDGDGTMMLHAWGATHERIEWYEGAAFHVVFVATCAIVFALYPTTRLNQATETGGSWTGWAPGALVRGRHRSREPAFHGVARVLAAGPRRVSAAACRHVLWLSVPLMTAALTIAAVLGAVLAFVRRWWTARERVAYAAFTAVAVAFIVFLNLLEAVGCSVLTGTPEGVPYKVNKADRHPKGVPYEVNRADRHP